MVRQISTGLDPWLTRWAADLRRSAADQAGSRALFLYVITAAPLLLQESVLAGRGPSSFRLDSPSARRRMNPEETPPAGRCHVHLRQRLREPNHSGEWLPPWDRREK